MSRSSRKQEKSGGLLATSGLLDRLRHVRKRKRAFGGQTLDMAALRRRLVEEQKRRHDR